MVGRVCAGIACAACGFGTPPLKLAGDQNLVVYGASPLKAPSKLLGPPTLSLLRAPAPLSPCRHLSRAPRKAGTPSKPCPGANQAPKGLDFDACICTSTECLRLYFECF